MNYVIIQLSDETVFNRFINCGKCRGIPILLDLQEIEIVRYIFQTSLGVSYAKANDG